MDDDGLKWGVRWCNDLTGVQGRGSPQYTFEEAERRCREMSENDPDTRYAPYQAKAKYRTSPQGRGMSDGAEGRIH